MKCCCSGRFELAAVVAIAIGVLTGCAEIPYAGRNYYPADQRSDSQFIDIREPRPKIAVAGIVQFDVYDDKAHQRGFETAGLTLETLTSAAASGLARHAGLESASLAGLPLQPECPPAGDIPRTLPFVSCELPAELAVTTAIDRMRADGYSHVLLLVGVAIKDIWNSTGRLSWIGGFLGAAPIGWEMDVQYKFIVHAGLYELQTGARISQASTEDFSRSADARLLGVVPIGGSLSASAREFFDALGRATGEEIARRIRLGAAGDVKL